MKVVNAGTTPFDTIVNVRGVDRVDPTATAVVLAGDPKTVNTLDGAPEGRTEARDDRRSVGVVPPRLPAALLTILRLKTSPNRQ